MSDNKERSVLTNVGAFWKKTKNGKQFLSGNVQLGDSKFNALIFKNDKSKPTQPDYRLVIADLSDELVPSLEGAPSKGNKAKSVAQKAPVNDVDSDSYDDIPF